MTEAGDMGETGALAGYLELLQTGFPSLRVERYILLGEGWDSVALLVNDQHVFRFAKRPDAAVRQAREAELLHLVAEHLPLQVPRFTHTWTDPAWPGTRIVGYRLIPGEPLMPERARPDRRAEQAARLGEFVSALHAIPIDVARRHGAQGGNAASRREAYRRFFATVRSDMLPLFSAREQAAIVAFWSRYLDDDACFSFTPRLVHRDLIREHVLVDPAIGHLTGVIDWGDAGIDDPAVDFAGVWRQLGEEFARQMLAAYRHPTDAMLLERLAFYAGMEPFHEIRFGQVHDDAAHLARGVAWARRQCAEA